MTRAIPISVVETPEFLSATRKLMNDEERALLVIISPTIQRPATSSPERLACGSFGGDWKAGASAAAHG